MDGMDSPLSHLDDAVKAYQASRDDVRERAGLGQPVGLGAPPEGDGSDLEDPEFDPLEDTDDDGL